MQLKMTSKTDDGIVIIACSGRIVYGAESSLLREKIKKALLESNRIVLNLQNISYVDSGGLGTLVGLRTSAQNAAGTLKLANVTKRVSDVLETTKLHTVFGVYNSEAEAIDSFRHAA